MKSVRVISRVARGVHPAPSTGTNLTHRLCYTTDNNNSGTPPTPGRTNTNNNIRKANTSANNTNRPPNPNSPRAPNQPRATNTQARPSPFFRSSNTSTQQGNSNTAGNQGSTEPRKFTQFNRPAGGVPGGVAGGSVSFSNPARAFVPPRQAPGNTNFNLQNRGGFNQKVGTQGNPGPGPGGYAYAQRSAANAYQAPATRPGLGPPAVTRANGGVANKQYIKVQEKKNCPICSNEIKFDFRHVNFLSQFVTEHSGMILPSRLTGVCAKQQRKLAKCIKRSRAMGLMAFTGPTPGIADNLPRMG